MALCTDPTCWPDRPHEHLPLYDPPGTTRLELIRQRLAGEEVVSCEDPREVPLAP